VLIVGIALAAPIALITRYVQPASDVPAPALWARPIVAADAVAFYLGKIVWPVQLTVDYGRTPAAVFASRAAYWTWLVPLAITIVVLLTRKRILIGAWLIFLAAPAANLGLLPFDFQIVSTVADHYVYLGLLAVALALAWAVSNWPTIATPPIAGLLLLLGILSFIQAGRWNDSYALWRHALAVNPNSGLAYGNLGVAYLNGGNANAALSLLIRATAIDPHDPFAQLNLIRAQLAVGQTGAAADSAERLVAAYRRRSDFDPQLVAAVLDRFAAAIAARGDASSAERLRNEAARLRIPQEK
jgi:tetratricopeptide (TPR) repeat protein